MEIMRVFQYYNFIFLFLFVSSPIEWGGGRTYVACVVPYQEIQSLPHPSALNQRMRQRLWKLPSLLCLQIPVPVAYSMLRCNTDFVWHVCERPYVYTFDTSTTATLC